MLGAAVCFRQQQMQSVDYEQSVFWAPSEDSCSKIAIAFIDHGQPILSLRKRLSAIGNSAKQRKKRQFPWFVARHSPAFIHKGNTHVGLPLALVRSLFSTAGLFLTCLPLGRRQY